MPFQNTDTSALQLLKSIKNYSESRLTEQKLTLTGILVFLLVPESPYYLAWKSGDVESARSR